MKSTAYIISIIFHPLLILSYLTLILIWVDPFSFGSYSVSNEVPLIMMVFFSTVIIPAIAIAMMKGLKLVQTLDMESRKERIIPLIAVMVCYFSMYMFIHSNADIPESLKIVGLGTCISLALGFMVNTVFKISLHSIAMGALWTVVFFLTTRQYYRFLSLDFGKLGTYEMDIVLFFIIVTIITGIVMSSRLFLKSHTKQEVYLGFIIGMVAQFIAYIFYQIWI